MSADEDLRFHNAAERAATQSVPALLERLGERIELDDDEELLREALVAALLLGFRAGVIEAVAQLVEAGVADVRLDRPRVVLEPPFDGIENRL